MINTHYLELPLSRKYFHSPKCVRTIEVRLYRLFSTLHYRMADLLIAFQNEKKKKKKKYIYTQRA